MSIICPNCGHDEEDSALFCTQCNTKLVDEEGQSTLAVDSARLAGVSADQERSIEAIEAKGARVSLHLLGSGRILPLLGNDEFILGRVSEGQSILPDVDLEPFHAYEAGVSRLHALVKVHKSQVSITDLGSSNGTLVNNMSISPHVQHSLNHKDVIRLGKLDIQTLLSES